MPSVAHAPLTNGVDLVPKEKTIDPKPTHSSSGFTAVNSRGSISPTQATPHANGTADGPHSVRSNSNSDGEDRKPRVNRPGEHWNFSQFRSQKATSPPADRQSSVSSAHKRKRSDTDDTSYSGAAVSSDRVQRRIDGYESSRSPRSIPGDGSHSNPNSATRSNSVGYPQAHWHSRERSGTVTAEGQYVENRESMESPRRTSEYENGEDSRASAGPSHPGNTSTTETTRAGVQVDPKKRKRQFANRTKTGCQTCRRRKKKCDEAKPECSNCIRGGFVCEGYQVKSSWPKPSVNRGPPVVIQAKDGYDNQQPSYNAHSRREFEHPAPPDSNRPRPHAEEPERQNSNRPWNGWQDPNPPPRSYTHPPPAEYTQAHAPPDARGRLPPKGYPDAPPLAGGPPPNYGHGHPHSMGPNPAATAQLALQHPSSNTHRHPGQPHQAPPQPATEKDKMLRGEHYLLFAPQLVDEREQCKSALWRFNNATNPAMGVSREERQRLFTTVLAAPYIHRSAAFANNPPMGAVGRDVHVEAPFTCDYGSNISIGDSVVIGSNCTILDPCKIIIGARTVIGPNVNILGNTVSIPMRNRNGSKGTAYGAPIHIEEDVFIGGNVTIVPKKEGITIGKGTTIGAGSVVTKSMPPFTVCAGNPAKVIRGIWDH